MWGCVISIVLFVYMDCIVLSGDCPRWVSSVGLQAGLINSCMYRGLGDCPRWRRQFRKWIKVKHKTASADEARTSNVHS